MVDHITLFLMGIGICMDALIVSMCKGLAMKKVTLRSMVIVGLWFGAFHAIMPLIGYFIGEEIHDFISRIDHWIFLLVLGYIGIMLIREAISDKEDEAVSASTSVRTMLPMSVALSLDAFAVGISFAATDTPPAWGVVNLGITAFAMSALGLYIGGRFGNRFGRIAGMTGGILLIALGIFAVLDGEINGHRFQWKRWSPEGGIGTIASMNHQCDLAQ